MAKEIVYGDTVHEEEITSQTPFPWEDDPVRKEHWQKFMRERLHIQPEDAKYVCSGFSLRDMYDAFVAGRESTRGKGK